MSENMKIWDAVSKTDPRYTKAVSMGRKFTSVDGQYVIKRATEVLGPIGQTWMWDAKHSILEMKDRTLAICDVEVRVRPAEGGHSATWGSWGPVRATNELVNAKGRFDEDAPKKAMTDALTKALSHLGVAADVYLGMFDDSKYVEQVRDEFAEQVQKISKTQFEVLNGLADEAGVDKAKICAAFGLTSLAELPADQYRRVEKRLLDLKEKASG